MSNFLIQSRFGVAGNFEAVLPGNGGLGTPMILHDPCPTKAVRT
jgi:hypothetical protein